MKPTLNVVFDIGNVLMSWSPQRLLSNLEFTPAQQQLALQQVVGSKPWLALDRGDISMAVAVAESASCSGMAEADLWAIYQGVGPSMHPLEPMVQAAQKLKAQGYPIYVLSNMPEQTWAHLSEYVSMFSEFNGLIISYKENLIKPEAAIYRLLTQRYKLVPQRTLFIDDHLPNIEAARAEGWHGMHMVDPEQPEVHAQQLLTTVGQLSLEG